jgi:carboxylate-amine ligase
MLDELIASEVILDRKMAYFEVRPSSHLPTLELRICDACPVVDDAVLIAGLFRALVHRAVVQIEAGLPRVEVPLPLHRAGMWQASRQGLAGNLLMGTAQPRPMPAATAVRALVDALRESLEALGDWEEVRALAEALLARGNSADRQRAAFAARGDLDDVTRLVVAETHGRPEARPPR